MAEDQIRSLQGTEDVLPSGWAYWRRLEEAARRLFERYGYGEIRTPVIEQTSLFIKGTGETTDVVEKEMYTIPAGSDEPEDEGSVALRPEGTPPVIRSYLEHSLHRQDRFQKLCYVGPMFRHERPQKGRLRQFHQLGIEAIGSESPLLDAETIVLACEVFREIGLSGFALYLNSMGSSESRARMRRRLSKRLDARRDELCEDCLRRLERNVFRVFDCKNEGCRAVVAEMPPITDELSPPDREHYEAVQAALGRQGVAFEQDPHLVRGLDYYTRTVYEIKHPALGARDTICGGGRYDDLVELLGGPSLPCVGFAIGAEPTLLAMEAELGEGPQAGPRPDVYVVSFGDEARPQCFDLLGELRRAGVAADMDYEGRSPKSQMRVANRLDAPLCLLLGPDEAARGEVTMRDMAAARQWPVPREEAVRRARAWLAGEETPC